MHRLSHILPRLVVLFPCLLLAGGCATNQYPGTTIPRNRHSKRNHHHPGNHRLYG